MSMERRRGPGGCFSQRGPAYSLRGTKAGEGASAIVLQATVSGWTPVVTSAPEVVTSTVT